MRIAVDTLVLGKRFQNTGTYVYARNLLMEFSKHLADRPSINLTGFAAEPNTEEAELLKRLEFEIVYSKAFRQRTFWRFGGLSRAASTARVDIVFSPSAHVFPFAVPMVSTIHDIMPLVLPSHLVHRGRISNFLIRLSASRSTKLLTDSQHSKNDLIRVFELPQDRIQVVYLGYDKRRYNADPIDQSAQTTVLSRYRIRQPFIVHHGMVQSRKNLKRLVEAFDLLRQTRRSDRFQLVLAGPFGYQSREIQESAMRLDPTGDSIIFTGALSDDDLATLVKSACLAVIPSLYEGFCLPLVEAMACGVPTIAATTSCLPEISGSQLRYFDAYDSVAMYELIRDVLDSPELQSQLASSGLERSRSFSWERCARETLAVLVNTCSEIACN